MTPSFQGEVQLAGWAESHNGGCKVTFWLSDPEDLDAFRTMTVKKGNTAGQRFMAVLVEIGDDEKPIEPEPVKKGGPLSQWFAMRLKEPAFEQWARRYFSVYHGITVEEALLGRLNVPSKRFIDDVGDEFKSLVMRPWESHTKQYTEV